MLAEERLDVLQVSKTMMQTQGIDAAIGKCVVMPRSVLPERRPTRSDRSCVRLDGAFGAAERRALRGDRIYGRAGKDWRAHQLRVESVGIAEYL